MDLNNYSTKKSATAGALGLGLISSNADQAGPMCSQPYRVSPAEAAAVDEVQTHPTPVPTLEQHKIMFTAEL